WIGGLRQRDRAIFDARLRKTDSGREEVVVVDAREAERALVHRLLGYLRCRDAGDIFAVVKDRLRWLHVIAREEASSASRRADVAKARSPLHERIERSTVALAHGSAEGNDVRF